MRQRRLLLVVQETFAVKGRGLIVAPDVDLGSAFQQHVSVELRRPDGTVANAEALAQIPFVDPPRPGRYPRHMLTFRSLTRGDLPIGTEVWLIE